MRAASLAVAVALVACAKKSAAPAETTPAPTETTPAPVEPQAEAELSFACPDDHPVTCASGDCCLPGYTCEQDDGTCHGPSGDVIDTVCPLNTYGCTDGPGCCPNGYTCCEVAGEPQCCEA